MPRAIGKVLVKCKQIDVNMGDISFTFPLKILPSIMQYPVDTSVLVFLGCCKWSKKDNNNWMNVTQMSVYGHYMLQ